MTFNNPIVCSLSNYTFAREAAKKSSFLNDSAIKGEGGKAPLGGGAVNPPAAKKSKFFSQNENKMLRMYRNKRICKNIL